MIKFIKLEQLIKPKNWNLKQEINSILKQKLKMAIDKYGYGIITVRELKPNLYEIIDGIKRIDILKETQQYYDKIACDNHGKISTTDAFILARCLNHQWSEIDVNKYAEQMAKIAIIKPVNTLANILPESAEELKQLSILHEFDWSCFRKAIKTPFL